MSGWNWKHAAVIGKPVDGTHLCMPQALHLAKLPQVEEKGELSGHCPQRQEGSQDLGEQENKIDEVDDSLQRQNDNAFICDEEQQHGQLERERQEPEGCQGWHLMTRRKETESGA